jgi:rhodanese-related sulfurtransferase
MNQAISTDATSKISVGEVRKLLEMGRDVTIVDSRSADAWGESNIKAKGAVRVPPDDIERYIGGVSPDEFIVTYCT